MKLDKIIRFVTNGMALIGFFIVLCAVSIDDFYTTGYLNHSFTRTLLLIIIGLIMFVPKIVELIFDCWED